MTALTKKRCTPEEYLALERESDIKHEYFDGEIFTMSGASPDHDRIAGEVYSSFLAQFRKRNRDVFSDDVRVRISPRRFVHPDISAVCGEAEFSDEAGLQHLLNPTLIVEVLSTSTEQHDRGTKLFYYRSLDSLKEYGLISQRMPLIEVYTRQPGGKWLYTAAQGLDAVVTLESIGCTLALADVYQRVTFEPDEEDL